MKKILKSVLHKREKRRLKREEKEKFKEWREKVLQRDRYTCQICKKQSGNLNIYVHHILDKTHFKELKFDVFNGLTLCYQDHKVGKYSPHMNALFFSFWLQKNKTEQYNYLINKLKEKELK